MSRPCGSGTHEAGWQLRQSATVAERKLFSPRTSQEVVSQYLVKARSSSSLATNASPLMLRAAGKCALAVPQRWELWLQSCWIGLPDQVMYPIFKRMLQPASTARNQSGQARQRRLYVANQAMCRLHDNVVTICLTMSIVDSDSCEASARGCWTKLTRLHVHMPCQHISKCKMFASACFIRVRLSAVCTRSAFAA